MRRRRRVEVRREDDQRRAPEELDGELEVEDEDRDDCTRAAGLPARPVPSYRLRNGSLRGFWQGDW